MSNSTKTVTTLSADLIEVAINCLGAALSAQNREKEDRALNLAAHYLQTGAIKADDVREYLDETPVFADEDDFERASALIGRNEAIFDLLDEAQLEQLAELVIRAL